MITREATVVCIVVDVAVSVASVAALSGPEG
jgi:hypothetical protein